MSRTACAIGKDYVPASFKGVLFYCTEANIEGGRRGAEGEFPFGEQTAYADLGRKIRVYHLTAAFREDNHVWDSQALFSACESPGPGMLVHPTRGAVMAACRSVKVSDKIEESAGETTAELEFVEANEMFGTSAFGGLGGSIFGIISTGLFETSQASFLRDYTPAVVPHPWLTDVINTAQHLITVVSDASEQVLTADTSLSVWRKVLRMKEVANDDGLAAIADNVDVSLVDGFNIVSNGIADPGPKYTVLRRLANAATSSSALPLGPATVSEQAVLSRHRLLAAVGMAEAAMGRNYSHVDEGLATMDSVLAVFEDEAHAAYANCDNALFMQIKQYSTQFSKMMHDLTYRLPAKILIDFSAGVHPLTAAYAIYRDAKRHRELEPRNIIDANGRFGPVVSAVSPV